MKRKKRKTYGSSDDPRHEPNANNCFLLDDDPYIDISTETSMIDCQDCTSWTCKYMKPGMREEFEEGELASMFPDGIDDGYHWNKEDGG